MAAEASFARWRERVESRLAEAIEAGSVEPRLRAAMRHATLGGGKRLRALLAYAAAEACGANGAHADAAACAVECVHAFSLVHDDLPAMDDDALRRGQPTVHVAFDEATAILAGDALQALAFEVLAASPLPAEARVAQVRELAIATGAAGMCAGQSLDMQAGANDLSSLEALHSLKTGALIRAAVRLGALAGGADAGLRMALDGYADALGLAFQIRDDLLDVEGDDAQLGKTAGKDVAQGKATYVSLAGAVAARKRLDALAQGMEAALAPLGPRAEPLRALARFAIARSH
jgi:farnesyl diphosphate synthase